MGRISEDYEVIWKECFATGICLTACCPETQAFPWVAAHLWLMKHNGVLLNALGTWECLQYSEWEMILIVKIAELHSSKNMRKDVMCVRRLDICYNDDWYYTLGVYISLTPKNLWGLITQKMLVIMGVIIDVPHLRYIFLLCLHLKNKPAHTGHACQISVPISNSNSNSTEEVMLCGWNERMLMTPKKLLS